LHGLRGSRFHGELGLVVVMMTVAFAGGGHLGAQQGSERAKREEEGSTKTVYSTWSYSYTWPCILKQMALLIYMNPLTRPVFHHYGEWRALEILYGQVASGLGAKPHLKKTMRFVRNSRSAFALKKVVCATNFIEIFLKLSAVVRNSRSAFALKKVVCATIFTGNPL